MEIDETLDEASNLAPKKLHKIQTCQCSWHSIDYNKYSLSTNENYL